MATKKKLSPVTPAMQRYVADFTMSLGTLQWSGGLVGIRAKEKSKPKLTYISPNGKAVEQRYIEEGTGTLFEVKQLNKVYTNGDEETILTPDEVDEIGGSSKPLNILPLTIHDAADVDRFIFPAENQGYVFQPEIKVPELQRIFNAIKLLLAAGDRALIGVCNLQNHEGLFRIDVWRGHVFLQKQCYPAEIKPHVPVETFVVEEATEDWSMDHLLQKDLDAVMRMFARQSQPFDPETYKNAIAERQFALLANPELIRVPVAAAPDVQADVDAFLAAFGD